MAEGYENVTQQQRIALIDSVKDSFSLGMQEMTKTLSGGASPTSLEHSHDKHCISQQLDGWEDHISGMRK